MKDKQYVYNESNKHTEVTLNKFSKKEIENILSSTENRDDRQIKSQAFCDYLCDKFKIPRLEVRVVNRPQPHSNTDTGRLRSKTLGTYTVGREVITMYNLTSKQQKVVAIKTFTKTLLHEFIHHYDIYKLNLPTSYHTKGFYMRLSDLERKLKG